MQVLTEFAMSPVPLFLSALALTMSLCLLALTTRTYTEFRWPTRPYGRLRSSAHNRHKQKQLNCRALPPAMARHSSFSPL